MSATCSVGAIEIGPGCPLAVIAGPCVLEKPQTNDAIVGELREICAELALPLIFKASFDKANRSSVHSARGPGLARGLDELARIKDAFTVPVTTDVHDPSQAEPAGRIAEMLQVPAFLCRQTDLLVACAETGRAVNAKKGQFMAPTEMQHVTAKLREAGCGEIMLTERGTFFGYHRLVNDFIGLGDMMELGTAVCFDVTHSTQLPGAGQGVTTGRPERAGLLARAAVAAGVHAVFLECHPEPAEALSDAGTMQPLGRMRELLRDLAAIRAAVSAGEITQSQA